MNIILETERLYLRQFTEADAAFVRQLSAAPGVLQYIPEPIPASDEAAKEVIINIILPQYKNGLGRWATHLKDNNECIGWCGLKMIKGELTWVIVSCHLPGAKAMQQKQPKQLCNTATRN